MLIGKFKAAYRLTPVHYVFQKGILEKDTVIRILKSTSVSVMLLILEKSLCKQYNRRVVQFNVANLVLSTSWKWFEFNDIHGAKPSYHVLAKPWIGGFGLRRTIDFNPIIPYQ